MKVVTLIYVESIVMNDSWASAETPEFTRVSTGSKQETTLDPGNFDAILGHGNSSANETSVDPRSCMSSVLLAMILAAIVLLTITGNVLVIASVVLNGNLRTTTNYFIANLAIADLLLGTTVLPFSATLEVLQYWVFGQFFCDVWAAIDVLCCTASILSLCVISIDRYIGVTRPLQHARIMRHTRAVYIIIFVWLLSMAISVAPLIGWKEEVDPDPRVCTVTTQPGYVLFSVAGSFYIPCFIILIVYFRIYQETVKYTKCLMSGAKLSKVDEENVVSLRIHTGRLTPADPSRRDSSSNPPDDDLGSTPDGGWPQQLLKKESSCKRNSRLTFSNKVAKFKREKKAAKTLGIVVGVFITCWLPFFFILPLDSLCPSCSVPPLLFKLFFWLGYCNSTMNPIIYTCSSLEFRRAFLSILCCRRCRTRPRVSLTEMQLRTKVPVVRHRHLLRRPHHHHHHQQQQQQQQHLNISSFQMMTRCPSSAPGGPPLMGKGPNGDQPLINPYLGCECVIPDCGNALGIIRYRDAKSVSANQCPACSSSTTSSSNGHVHLKMIESTYRHEMSVYASIDHPDPHRSCGGSKSRHCSGDRNGSPMVSANSSNSTLSSTSSLESPTRRRALPGHQSYSSSKANGHCKTHSSSGFDADDGGIITLSFYSLAETLSCSD